MTLSRGRGTLDKTTSLLRLPWKFWENSFPNEVKTFFWSSMEIREKILSNCGEDPFFWCSIGL